MTGNLSFCHESLSSERHQHAILQAVVQADVLQPPLLQPVYSFWSPIPTRTPPMTAQLQGNQILPLPGYQNQVILGAIRKSLANVATFVSLDTITPSSQGRHAPHETM